MPCACCLQEGTVQLAVVFERPGIDERESFLEAGSQLLVAVVAPGHVLAQEQNLAVREELLAEQRQIMVGSGRPQGADPRMVLSRRFWLTDSYQATLDSSRPAWVGPTCHSLWCSR